MTRPPDLQIISLSIADYCSKVESIFISEMQQSESKASSAKQKAWVEKARSTIAHLQGDRKIQAFFNFTPAVSGAIDWRSEAYGNSHA